MRRRNFLKLLGLAPAAPSIVAKAIVAVPPAAVIRPQFSDAELRRLTALLRRRRAAMLRDLERRIEDRFWSNKGTSV